MKIKLLLLLALLPLVGCVLVPTDFMPKPVWYWSQAAKDHRAEVAREKAANARYKKDHQP